jgi:hypothetical protein
LKAKDEIEQGLLEERREQLIQERTQREMEERKNVLKLELAELQARLSSAEEKQARLQKGLLKEESIRRGTEKDGYGGAPRRRQLCHQVQVDGLRGHYMLLKRSAMEEAAAGYFQRPNVQAITKAPWSS